MLRYNYKIRKLTSPMFLRRSANPVTSRDCVESASDVILPLLLPRLLLGGATGVISGLSWGGSELPRVSFRLKNWGDCLELDRGSVDLVKIYLLCDSFK